jgi:DNA gyrase subunit B
MKDDEKTEWVIPLEKSGYNANQITKLEFPETIRRRPGMYIGLLDSTGLFLLFKEVIADTMGEVAAGYCDQIKVTLGKDYSITVEDNGRGIPVEINKQTDESIIDLAMTVSSHLIPKPYRGHSVGLFGIGYPVVNALSDWMETTVKVEGSVYRLRFERGVMTEPLHIIGACSTEETGTTQKWLADKTMFQGDALDKNGNLNYSPDRFVACIRELCFLNKNITIIWHDEFHDREPITFHFEEGVKGYVASLNADKQALYDSIFYCVGSEMLVDLWSKEEESIASVEVAFQHTAQGEENIYCFANNIPQPEGGTHLSGFKTALTRTFKQFARKHGLSDDFIEGEKLRLGITAIVSVRLKTPQFNSQDKVKLTSPDVEGLVRSVVGKAVAAFCEEKPDVARAIIQKALSA